MFTFNLIHPGYTIDVGKDIAPGLDKVDTER
jgi:hypothetical protein